jgi:hypothetical protein
MDGDPGAPGVPGLRGMKGDPGVTRSVPRGISYTRWGGSTCPTGVTRIYKGWVGSSLSSDTGGASNYLCMPEDPEYSLPSRPGVQGESFVYSTEYKSPIVTIRNQYDAPCAVCFIPNRSAVVQIPAKTNCPSGWTREYYGYLMSANIGSHRTTFECVNRSTQTLPDTQSDTPGGQFWHVEASCGGGLACPPYDEEKELPCVVCSK